MSQFSQILLVLILTIFACQPSSNTDQSKATNSDTPKDTVPVSEVNTQAPLPKSAEQNAQATFAKPTTLQLPELEKLCQNKYGCLRETIYPFGWSADGKFAYLLARTNEAVNNYTLDFYIQDMTTNAEVASLQYQASEQASYAEDSDAYNFDSAWEAKAKDFRELVETHGIIPFSGTSLQALSTLDLTLETQDERKLSAYTGKEVLAKHQLHLTTQKAKRTISTREYGKYDLILGTEVLGVFPGPDGEHHALLEAEEQRGFEGPPNVMKLRVIGF